MTDVQRSPARCRALLRVAAAMLVTMLTSAASAQSAASDTTFPQNRPTCHARVYSATHLAAHPQQRVVAISFERRAREIALEKDFVADGEMTEDNIAATLRVRLRGETNGHVVRLECEGPRNGPRYCESPVCPGGEIGIAPNGNNAIRVSIGGTLRNGAFVPHYLHLDNSCETSRPVMLQSGADDHEFLLPAASAKACR